MLVSLPLHSASVNRQSYSGVRRRRMSIPDLQILVQTTLQWYESLSLTGKFVFPIFGIAGLVTLFLIYRALYTSFILIRRFIRRKLIPKNIDLRLDRDVAPEERVEPSLEDVEESEIQYGTNLKDRIEQMRKDAPFKRDDE